MRQVQGVKARIFGGISPSVPFHEPQGTRRAGGYNSHPSSSILLPVEGRRKKPAGVSRNIGGSGGQGANRSGNSLPVEGRGRKPAGAAFHKAVHGHVRVPSTKPCNLAKSARIGAATTTASVSVGTSTRPRRLFFGITGANKFPDGGDFRFAVDAVVLGKFTPEDVEAGGL